MTNPLTAVRSALDFYARHHHCLNTTAPNFAREALAALQQDGWRPIESAPKDGTEILCTWLGREEFHVLAWFPNWNDGQGAWVMDGDFAVRFEPDGVHETPPIDAGNPTHWQPLPAPPRSHAHERL